MGRDVPEAIELRINAHNRYTDFICSEEKSLWDCAPCAALITLLLVPDVLAFEIKIIKIEYKLGKVLRQPVKSAKTVYCCVEIDQKEILKKVGASECFDLLKQFPSPFFELYGVAL